MHLSSETRKSGLEGRRVRAFQRVNGIVLVLVVVLVLEDEDESEYEDDGMV